MKKIIDSSEQTEILNSLDDEKNITIKAYAGCGKTSTLRKIAESKPEKTVLYMAFNKAIVEDAKKTFPKNTKAATTHSIAYGPTKSLLKFSSCVNLRARDISDHYNIPYKMSFILLKIFKGYCHSNYQSITKENIKNIIEKDDSFVTEYNPVFYLDRLHKLLISLWSDIEKGNIGMSHDFYLKYFELNYDKFFTNVYYDILLLDEAQDTNDVTLSLFEKIKSDYKIIVGDEYQKIYGFRDAINGMKKFDKNKIKYLTQSFRLNEKNASYANSLLNNFFDEKKPLKHYHSETSDIETKAYIHRTNAGIINTISFLVDKKIHFNTIRKEDEIFSLVKSIISLKNNMPEMIDRDFSYLKKFKYEELADYADLANDVELKSGLSLIKTHKERIMFLYQQCQENNHTEAKIKITTAHTAKGLEWDEIVIGSDFPDISELFLDNEIFSLKDWKFMYKNNIKEKKIQYLQEELNLFYVAITRAKKNIISLAPGLLEYVKNPNYLNDMIKLKQKENKPRSQ